MTMPVFNSYTGEDRLTIPLSALEHYVYCKRQTALIHVERVWQDNRYTAEGSTNHHRVDDRGKHMLRGKEVWRGQQIWSHKYGLYGYADCVERTESGMLYPVEYKRSLKKEFQLKAATVQLCAQALCLEEMFTLAISQAFLFDNTSKQKIPIDIDEQLREKTITIIGSVRKILEEQYLPAPVYAERCTNCSLVTLCMPIAEQWF
jgi:CRISPR-associated exonuclease Cas4